MNIGDVPVLALAPHRDVDESALARILLRGPPIDEIAARAGALQEKAAGAGCRSTDRTLTVGLAVPDASRDSDRGNEL